MHYDWFEHEHGRLIVPHYQYKYIDRTQNESIKIQCHAVNSSLFKSKITGLANHSMMVKQSCE